MKKKVTLFIIIATMMVVFTSCGNDKADDVKSESSGAKLDITVKSASITEEPSADKNDDLANNLTLKFKIENNTDQDFYNVNIKMTFNEEAKPYMNNILEYSYMGINDIYSKEKYEELVKEGKTDVDGRIYGWSFNCGRSIGLASQTDSSEKAAPTTEDVYEAIKNVSFDITWDGGEQHEVFELDIDK